MPTFVTAHTFRGTRVSYGWCLLIQGYFCEVKNYAEKTELSKCSLYPERELGVTMHISEIKKSFNLKKKTPYIALYFTFFRIIVAFLSLKLRG